MSNTAFDPKAVLQLLGATKFFGKQKVIESLDLHLPKPEFVTFLGPSGCGKTTLLRLIAGLEPLDAGKIWLDGIEVTHAPAARRSTHTIFQKYALFPHMNVFDNVAFGLKMQRSVEPTEIKERVLEALASVQLEECMQQFPQKLSGGQQQRVAIARAIVNRPRLLLLDECLSALDYHLRRRLQNELKALQRKLQIPFVFVTHDQEEALGLSDRIFVLRNGRIEQSGTPRQIYESPRNLFVAKFVGDSNLFKAKILSIDAPHQATAVIEGHKCKLSLRNYLNKHRHLKAEDLVGRRLSVLLRPEDLRIKEIAAQQSALEHEGMIGWVRERNYRGMMLDSVIELNSGKMVLASEFFNEDDPDVDHSLQQRVAITWVPNWEVLLDG